MNKKVVSLIALVLLVSFCVVNVAVAESTFTTKVMDVIQGAVGIDDSDFVAGMMTTEFRPLTMAVLYADYVISDDKIDGAMEFEDFDFINDSYICKFGPSTIDAYFRLSNGKYLNLFYSAYTNTIKVYGITKTYKNSDDKTYYAVDGVEILGDFVKVAKAITN